MVWVSLLLFGEGVATNVETRAERSLPDSAPALSDSPLRARMAPARDRSWRLLRSVQVQYLRLVMSILVTFSAMFAANVSFMVRRSTRSPLLNSMLLVWIIALLYGGVSNTIAVVKNRVIIAALVVGCWLIVAALHIWYLVDNHYVTLLQQSSRWSLIAQVFCDLLCVVFIAVMALLLRWHEFVLLDTSVKLHALRDNAVAPSPANNPTVMEIHVVV